MLSTDLDFQPSDDELFTVANLALWAGDAARARRNLTEILRRNQATRGSVSVFAYPLLSSAQRALRQLDRRISEYRKLGKFSEQSYVRTQSREALQSSGAHLAGMIWVESERSFEFRCYLLDLSWEEHFYKMCATEIDKHVALNNIADLGIDKHVALDNIADLGYGSNGSRDEREGTDEADRVDTLELSWATTKGEMFLEVEVSDLCTLTAQSVWIGKEPPKSSDQLIAVFQEVLNVLDPGKTSNR